MGERGTTFHGPLGVGAGGYQSLTGDYTVNARNDNGRTFGLNAAGGFDVVLPPVAQAGAGWRCRFRVETAPTGGDAYTVSEDTAHDTDVLVSQINELEVDTGDDGPRSAAHTVVSFVEEIAVVGDYIDVECNGSKYFITGQTNADGGIALT